MSITIPINYAKPAFAAAYFPSAETPFLKWQVRVPEERPMLIPKFEERTLTGHVKSGEVTVERLVGWGETKEQAEAMARRNAK